MFLRDIVKDIVEDSLKKAIESGDLSAGNYPVVKIDYPKDEKFGDFSSSLALESAKIFRKSPVDLGNILKEHIIKHKIIGKVEVVKPGFINIFLSLDFLYNNMLSIIEAGAQYGRTTKEKPDRINIEFVSANPTGPLVIVSARAAALGDTIGNLLEASGNIVDREFYVNDYGNQVSLLGKSVLCRYRELMGQTIDFPEEAYHGEYIKDIAAYCRENFSKEIDLFKNEEDLIDFLAGKAVEYNIKGQKAELEKFNISYDRWFMESSLHENNEVSKTLEFLESKGVIYIEEDKKVFRSTDFGDDKDRVVVRDDGRPTYLLADIAYHKNKLDRGYDRIIDIWGPDHHGYIARIMGAMTALGCREGGIKILIAQQVNLVMEGEQVKMSKRLGKFSTMKELIDDIGPDVARYFFIMRSMESHLDFDLDLARRESSENPVFYLQYAHARICSIFREAVKRGIEYSYKESEKEYLKNPESVSLLKLLAKYPEEVNDSANNYEPHRIPAYLLRLAQGFHKFYTEHKVLCDNKGERNTYLSICESTGIVIKNGLNILGISAPEKM